MREQGALINAGPSAMWSPRGQGAAVKTPNRKGARGMMTYAPAFAEETFDVHAWLVRLGAALQKGERKNIRVLDNGRAELVIEYANLGDMLKVLIELDALKAIAIEDFRGR
jgi:hypothetical protein